MIHYHGTTRERERSILANGLKKGSWVSPDKFVAEHFARSRSAYNDQEPVIFELTGCRIKNDRLDKEGRRECQLKEGIPAKRIREMVHGK